MSSELSFIMEDIAEVELLELNVGPCEGALEECGHVGPRVEIGSRHMGIDESYVVCTRCAIRYTQHWDEMWSDYWSDRL